VHSAKTHTGPPACAQVQAICGVLRTGGPEEGHALSCPSGRPTCLPQHAVLAERSFRKEAQGAAACRIAGSLFSCRPPLPGSRSPHMFDWLGDWRPKEATAAGAQGASVQHASRVGGGWRLGPSSLQNRAQASAHTVSAAHGVRGAC